MLGIELPGSAVGVNLDIHLGEARTYRGTRVKHIWTGQSTSDAKTKRAAERREVAFPARLTWKDQHGTTRFASVVARNISEFGVYVEAHSVVSLPLYRLVQFQLEREARESDALPAALRQGRVLSAGLPCVASSIGQTAGVCAPADGGSEAAAGSRRARARDRVSAIKNQRAGWRCAGLPARVPFGILPVCATFSTALLPCPSWYGHPIERRARSPVARRRWLLSWPWSRSTRAPTRACGPSTIRRRTVIQKRLRVHGHRRLARPPAAVERPAQRRRLRLVRLRRRPRPDQPSRRRRPAAEALHAAEELRRRRLLRADAAPRRSRRRTWSSTC